MNTPIRILSKAKTRLFFLLDGMPQGFLKTFAWWAYCRVALILNNEKRGVIRSNFQDGFFHLITPLGTLKFLYKPFDDYACTQIAYLKHYPLKSGDVVVDAGAYQGVTTVIFARKVGPAGHVFAFEPDDKNRDSLKRNLEANDVRNVTIIPKGLWSENTRMQFRQGMHVASAIIRPWISGLNGDSFIEVVSLDSEMEKLGIKKIDFVKMDIEGAEVEAIKGLSEIARNNSLSMAIASYHCVNGSKTYALLERELPKLGFKNVFTEKDWLGGANYETTYAAT
jgi:FkbM family methyltransferase